MSVCHGPLVVPRAKKCIFSRAALARSPPARSSPTGSSKLLAVEMVSSLMPLSDAGFLARPSMSGVALPSAIVHSSPAAARLSFVSEVFFRSASISGGTSALSRV